MHDSDRYAIGFKVAGDEEDYLGSEDATSVDRNNTLVATLKL